MDDIKLSVIVPIFNVEEYLEECLESIRKAIRGIKAEVLMIDDSSSDTSNNDVSLAKGEYIRRRSADLTKAQSLKQTR